jgi:hypothetical protein
MRDFPQKGALFAIRSNRALARFHRPRIETQLKSRVPLGGLDEWFKSHAWKACLG